MGNEEIIWKENPSDGDFRNSTLRKKNALSLETSLDGEASSGSLIAKQSV